MIDLSHLTEEEQSMIMTVLKRDEELKKAEEERIRNLQRNSAPVESRHKYLTGEWFYAAKSQRHNDKIHGSEIILASMKQRKADLSKTENPRVSELTPPPKPARLLETSTQPRETSESLNVSDAEKEKLNSVVRSPGRPRRNPFNRASFVLEAETMEKQLTNENQDDETSYKAEPLSPLKNPTAKGSTSHTSAGSVTSEGSSVGFRPVPKKRTFLSRRSQSSLTGSDVSIPGQLSHPVESKVNSPDPQGSIQQCPNGEFKLSSQVVVDKQSQESTTFSTSELQNNVTPVSPTSQRLKTLTDLPYKPLNDLILVPTTTELDTETGSHEQKRTAEEHSDDSLIRPDVITPSPVRETEGFKVLRRPMTDPKPLRLTDFTPVTPTDNDRHTDKYHKDGQRTEGSNGLIQRESFSVDPPQCGEWSDKFSESRSVTFCPTSELTTHTHRQPSQHAAFEILEKQDKEMIRSRNVGTAIRQGDLSLDTSMVDKWMHHERHKSGDRPENQVNKKTGGYQPAIESAPLRPQPTGEEGDSIAKVLEWFSRSVDSNDWLDTQNDQPDLQEDVFGSAITDTKDRPSYRSKTQQMEIKDPDLKKNLPHVDSGLYTQGVKGVSVFITPEVKDGFQSESSVDQLPNNSPLITYQPKRRMSEADRFKGKNRKELTLDREEDVKMFNDPPAKADVPQVTIQEVKQNAEVQNENQSPNISQLKSLWEKGNSGPKILISRPITEKVQPTIKKEQAEHKTVPESKYVNGSSRRDFRNGKENEQLHLQPSVTQNKQEVYTPKKTVVISPTLEILTLPTSWDDSYTPGTQSEENKSLPAEYAHFVDKELRRSPCTVDRRGSEAEILFQSTLNPQQETLSQSRLITPSESMFESQSRLTPESTIYSTPRLTPHPQLLLQPRVKPESVKLSPDLQKPQVELLSSPSQLPEPHFQSTGSETVNQTGQQNKVSDNLMGNDSEEKKGVFVQSVVSTKKLDEGITPNIQVPPQQDSKADKIKQLKSFWEQEKNRPIFYGSKSKEDGEAKGKLNKRLTKSEFDLRLICNDSDDAHEADSNHSSDKQRPNFSVFTMDQRLDKSSPGLGTNRLQFKNLCEFWGEATSRCNQTISTEKPKRPKKKEITRSTLDESKLLETSSPSSPCFPSSLSPPTSLVSSNKEREHQSRSRLIRPCSGAMTDTKANLSPRITVEQQRTPCVPQVRSGSKHDLTKEEKALKPQGTSGKGSRSHKARKGSFGNSSGSGRGSALRRANSMFTLDVNDKLDQTSLLQPKNIMDIRPVQPKRTQGRQQSSDKEPSRRSSSKSSDESETLTPRARAFIPSDYRHYLGITEKTNIQTVALTRPELNLSTGPVRSSTPVDSEESYSRRGSKITQNPLAPWSNHGSTDIGQESSFSISERTSSSASETWSISRTSSNRENDEDGNLVQKALKRAQIRPRNLTKSLEDITASMPPRQERRPAPLDDLRQSSIASTLPSPSSSLFSDPENVKKMSKSVPSFLQKEIDDKDTDSASEDGYHGSRHKMGKSMTNISSSSGMASLSGSVMTMYSGDYGGVEVQGNIEFSISYIQKLREFHIFVAQSRNLATVDPKRGRSDPYVKSYLVPDKANLGKRKTSVKKKTVNPIFNEILRYRVRMEYLKTQTLILSVWHHDTFGRNSFLGEVDVDLSKWDFDHTQMNCLSLKSRPTHTLQPLDDRGEMRLAIRFLPQVSHSLGKDSPSKTGEVHIWVKDCKNLPLIRGATIDPYVKCFVLPDTSRKSRQKTRVLRRTVEPIFNHTMVYDGFKQEDLNEACVELTVWDRDRLGSNLLGGLRLGPGTGRSYGAVVDWMDSNAAEVDLWERMMTSPNEWVEDVLPLRMLTTVKTKLK
ncbi:uncharacterized protein sytl2b isoform X2 [Esox lucius]|uniref:Synaptotagmin-like protein 2 n=1 Tax=Esox lucius TaxID=8010 RepID=A0A3P8YXN1_ESOLU|nr:uncharacterized protein sytl2b isoform X2 [Esox lucius]